MSEVMCDVMDCKHIKPMERIGGGEPFVGFCGAKLLNIFGTEERKCLTYEASEGDDDERKQVR